MTETKLKPCPFCGSMNRTETEDQEGWAIVLCDECGAQGPCISADPVKAANLWNTRPSPSVEKVARALWEQATRQTGLEPAKRPMTPNEREAFEPLARAAIAAINAFPDP